MGRFHRFCRSLGSRFQLCCRVGGNCSRKATEGRAKQRATPLPLTKMIVLTAVLFVSIFGIDMIFPFLPFMVHDFFPYLDKDELGQKAGYLGGAYFLGNFFGSFIWGVAADKLGRRTVLLMGVFFIIVCELFFGFSQNMVWAISARLLWGLSNGNVAVAKTYISEICDDTNLAKGFAAVGTAAAMARLIGSVIGGFLAQPANKYRLLEFQLFCDYPYCLPCLVGAGLSMFTLVGAWLFLDETLKKDKKDRSSLSLSRHDSGRDLITTGSDDTSNNHSHDSNDSDSGGENTQEDNNSDIFVDDVETDSDYNASSDTELLQNIQRLNQQKDVKFRLDRFRKACVHMFSPLRLARKVMQRLTECVRIFVCFAVWIKKFKYSRCRSSNVEHSSMNWKTVGSKVWKTVLLLKDRRVIVSISLYGLVAFLSIVANEIFPLMLVTDYEHGGYNMDPSEIGVILSAGAVLQLLFQSIVYPRVVKVLKYRKTFMIGLILFAVGIFVLPFSNQISGPISNHESNSSGSGDGMWNVSIPFCGYDSVDDFNSTSEIENSISRIPARVWAVIIFIFIVTIVGRVVSITSTIVFISNSSLPSTKATVNGYGQSAAALMRMLGPVTGAPLFSWSETLNKHWPLNYHLVFDLVAIGSIGSVTMTLLLPNSIEQKRESMTNHLSNDPENNSEQTVELVSIKTPPDAQNSEIYSRNENNRL